jgi:hypothetical protein
MNLKTGQVITDQQLINLINPATQPTAMNKENPKVVIDGNTIELKGLVRSAFASEETHCFAAVVWLNGRRVGEARNDGHGGNTWITCRNPKDTETLEAIAAKVKGQDFPGWEFLGEKPMSIDSIIDELVEQNLNLKHRLAALKRLRKRATENYWFIIDGDPATSYRGVKPNGRTPEQVRDRVKAQPGFKCFLAELPEDEFVAHFKL